MYSLSAAISIRTHGSAAELAAQHHTRNHPAADCRSTRPNAGSRAETFVPMVTTGNLHCEGSYAQVAATK